MALGSDPDVLITFGGDWSLLNRQIAELQSSLRLQLNITAGDDAGRAFQGITQDVREAKNLVDQFGRSLNDVNAEAVKSAASVQKSLTSYGEGFQLMTRKQQELAGELINNFNKIEREAFRSAEKLASEQIAAAEKSARRRQELEGEVILAYNKSWDLALREDQKRQASIAALAEKTARRRQELEGEVILNYNKAWDAALREEQKRQASILASAEKTARARQELEGQLILNYNKAWDEAIRTNRKLDEAVEKNAFSMGKLVDKFGSAIFTVGRFMIAYQAFNLVLGAARGLVEVDRQLTMISATMVDVDNKQQALAVSNNLVREAMTTYGISAEKAGGIVFELGKTMDNNAELMRAAFIPALSLLGLKEADQTETIRVLVGLYNIYGNTIEGATTPTEKFMRITDMLQKSSVLSVASVKDLSSAMQFVAGAAKQSAIPLEQILAVITILQDSLLRARQSGTGFARVLEQVREDGRKLAEIWRIEIDPANPDPFRLLLQIMEKVRSQGPPTQETLDKLKQSFTTMQGERVFEYLLESFDKIVPRTQSIKDSLGTTTQIVDELRKSVSAMATNLGNELIVQLDLFFSALFGTDPGRMQGMVTFLELMQGGIRRVGSAAAWAANEVNSFANNRLWKLLDYLPALGFMKNQPDFDPEEFGSPRGPAWLDKFRLGSAQGRTDNDFFRSFTRFKPGPNPRDWESENFWPEGLFPGGGVQGPATGMQGMQGILGSDKERGTGSSFSTNIANTEERARRIRLLADLHEQLRLESMIGDTSLSYETRIAVAQKASAISTQQRDVLRAKGVAGYKDEAHMIAEVTKAEKLAENDQKKARELTAEFTRSKLQNEKQLSRELSMVRKTDSDNFVAATEAEYENTLERNKKIFGETAKGAENKAALERANALAAEIRDEKLHKHRVELLNKSLTAFNAWDQEVRVLIEGQSVLTELEYNRQLGVVESNFAVRKSFLDASLAAGEISEETYTAAVVEETRKRQNAISSIEADANQKRFNDQVALANLRGIREANNVKVVLTALEQIQLAQESAASEELRRYNILLAARAGANQKMLTYVSSEIGAAENEAAAKIKADNAWKDLAISNIQTRIDAAGRERDMTIALMRDTDFQAAAMAASRITSYQSILGKATAVYTTIGEHASKTAALEADLAAAFAKATGNLGAYVMATLQKLKAELSDIMGEIGKSIVDTFANAQRTISDVFFDAFQGKLQSAATYWNAFLGSMYRTLADFMSRRVVGEFLNVLLGLGGQMGFSAGMPSSVTGATAGQGVQGGQVPIFGPGGQITGYAQAGLGLAGGVGNFASGVMNTSANWGANGLAGTLFGTAEQSFPAVMGMGADSAVTQAATSGWLGAGGAMSATSGVLAALAVAWNLYKGITEFDTNSGKGTLAGTAAGGIAGGIIGSIVPGIGTAIGALLGAALGGSLGGMAGGLFGSENPKQVFSGNFGFTGAGQGFGLDAAGKPSFGGYNAGAPSFSVAGQGQNMPADVQQQIKEILDQNVKFYQTILQTIPLESLKLIDFAQVNADIEKASVQGGHPSSGTASSEFFTKLPMAFNFAFLGQIQVAMNDALERSTSKYKVFADRFLKGPIQDIKDTFGQIEKMIGDPAAEGDLKKKVTELTQKFATIEALFSELQTFFTGMEKIANNLTLSTQDLLKTIALDQPTGIADIFTKKISEIDMSITNYLDAIAGGDVAPDLSTIATLISNRYQTEIEYLQQLDTLSKTVTKSLDEQIDDLIFKAMTPDDQKATLSSRISSAWIDLQQAYSAEQVAELVGRIQKDSATLLGMEKPGTTPQAVWEFLMQVREVAKQRLAAFEEQARESDGAFAKEMNRVLELFGADFKLVHGTWTAVISENTDALTKMLAQIDIAAIALKDIPLDAFGTATSAATANINQLAVAAKAAVAAFGGMGGGASSSADSATGSAQFGGWVHGGSYQHGGWIPGPGSGDSRRIFAEPGEFLIPRRIAQDNAGALNSLLSFGQMRGGGDRGGVVVNISVQVQNGGQLDDNFWRVNARSAARAIELEMRNKRR